MININKEIMAKVLDDKTFKEEVCELLSSFIDTELDKNDDEIDFDLIEECSNAIVFVSNEDLFNEKILNEFESEVLQNKIKKFSRRSIGASAKIILIAAVLLISTITANAAVSEFTGKSIFENIASEPKEITTQADVQITTPDNETTMSQTTTEQAVKNDESILFKKNTVKQKENGILLRKTNSDSSVISRGKEIEYKKKGTAPKRSLSFTVNDDFDEKDYLSTEYGIPYCELTKDNRHDFTPWTITEEPSCGTRGVKERVCKVCSSKQICPAEATGKHRGVLSYSLEKASVDSTGRCVYECENCDAFIEEKIASPKYILLDEDEFYYNGKAQHPKVSAVLDSDGYEIPSKYYSVRYSEGNSKNCMYAYSVIVDFNCDYYEESIVANYNIYPMSNNLAGIYVKDTSMIPYWNKNILSDANNTTGYQIQYSTNSDFKSAKTVTVKGMNNLSADIDNLKSDETYYVRMRVYYFDESYYKNMYSGWSDVRSVTIK